MKKIKAISLTAVLLTSLFMTGCSSKSGNTEYNTSANSAAINADKALYEEVSEAKGIAMQSEANTAEEQTAPQAIQSTERKLIKTVDISVETQEFDGLLTIIETKTVELGGYTENLNTYNGSIYDNSNSRKNASLTLRIPKQNLENFLATVSEAGNITNRSEYIEDVTLAYVDLESHKKALTTEQTRLLELLAKAESMEDIIAIEQRLSEVRYQIESMESMLRTYDNKVDYSTVYLYISEVEKLTPVLEETTGQRIARGLQDNITDIGHGLKELSIRLIISIPYLILAAIPITAILLVCLVLPARKRRKNQKNQAIWQNGEQACKKQETTNQDSPH